MELASFLNIEGKADITIVSISVNNTVESL
jgi:hypothetical protein